MPTQRPELKPMLSARALRAADAPISALMRQALEQPGLISLAAGFVDPTSLPAEATHTAATSLLSHPELARAALQYGSTAGNTQLRRQLLERVQRADAADSRAPRASLTEPPSEEQVVLTAGSNQILGLLADALLDVDDCVLCDAPTYFVFTGLIESVGARCIGIPSDEYGMLMPALEAELARQAAAGSLTRVKAIYVMSYFDNPRGVSLAAERRAELVALAQRYSRTHRIYVIEDAAYRELRFHGPDEASVRAYDPTGETVIYAGTFSKSFAPGVRVGFGILPRTLAPAVLSLKGNLDFGSPHLNQCLVQRALELDLLEPQAALLRKLYARKAQSMLTALDEHVAPLAGCRYQRPNGGLYVWLSLPAHVDTSARGRLFLRARELGVLYVPGEYCYPRPEASLGIERPSSSMRLSFGVQSDERIAEGIEKLARAITEAL
jgi:2-aminoadipate transaminase